MKCQCFPRYIKRNVTNTIYTRITNESGPNDDPCRIPLFACLFKHIFPLLFLLNNDFIHSLDLSVKSH